MGQMIRLVVMLSCAVMATACADDDNRNGWNVDQLQLPGDNYFPESLNAGADGTLYVGSLATGQIVRFVPGDVEAKVVAAASVDRNIAGVLADDATATVLACSGSLATFGRGNYVSRIAVTSGATTAKYPLPDGVFCNDLAFDGAHNLYLADSVGGRVFKLLDGAADGTAPSVWASHPSLLGPTAGDLGADGIAYDGTGSFYVNNVTTGALVRVPIQANGEAGTVVEIIVTPPLTGPDGMRALDERTLVVAEGPANRVSIVSVSGATAQRTTLTEQVTEPSSVVKVGRDAWISEGQILRMFTNPPSAPELPFLARRVPLP